MGSRRGSWPGSRPPPPRMPCSRPWRSAAAGRPARRATGGRGTPSTPGVRRVRPGGSLPPMGIEIDGSSAYEAAATEGAQEGPSPSAGAVAAFAVAKFGPRRCRGRPQSRRCRCWRTRLLTNAAAQTRRSAVLMRWSWIGASSRWRRDDANYNARSPNPAAPAAAAAAAALTLNPAGRRHTAPYQQQQPRQPQLQQH